MPRSPSSPRPPVTVVMPFAGTAQEGNAALRSLAALELDDDDELMLADNCGIALAVRAESAARSARVRVIDARGERSPAHARNAGAAAADTRSEWLLFLDADTVAPADLLDSYFAEPIADDVGAVAGGIVAAPLGPSAGVLARYGAHKNFLDPGAHLAHPFMPRAAAANLLVRRAAFNAVGGFFEGLRAAEDTDFSWRLQLAGWTLAGRPTAAIQHRYRDSLRDLRRQWRGYAAGRAWLGRRYDGFAPQPALLRAAAKATGRGPARLSAPAVAPPGRAEAAIPRSSAVATRDRVPFAALDAILGVEELIGLALSNRPAGDQPTELLSRGRGWESYVPPRSKRFPAVRRISAESQSAHVLVADRFPDDTGPGAPADVGDTRAGTVRIEAGGRADRAAPPAPGVTITYREDDGPLDRAAALTRLLARRPGNVLAAATGDHDAPSPAALAPAAYRLVADPSVTLSPSSADPFVKAAARRLGRLAGRELS